MAGKYTILYLILNAYYMYSDIMFLNVHHSSPTIFLIFHIHFYLFTSIQAQCLLRLLKLLLRSVI